MDHEFQTMMGKIFGEDFISKFSEDCPDDWLKILDDFEAQKRTEKDVGSEEVKVVLPSNFIASYSKEIGSDANLNDRLQEHYSPEQVSIGDDGHLHINPQVIRALYQPVLTETVSMIHTLLQHPRLAKVNTLFVVGGLSQALYYKRALAQAFPKKWILSPRDAELAIMKGAVMFARSPRLLTARVMAKTYSIDINEKFDPEMHPVEKRSIVGEMTYCEGVLDELVRVEEQITLTEKRSFFFSPVHPNQTCAVLRFYSTQNKDAKFTNDPDVVAENVAFEVLSSDVTNGLSRNIELDVYFGGPEIKVDVTDVTTGSTSKAALKLVAKILASP